MFGTLGDKTASNEVDGDVSSEEEAGPSLKGNRATNHAIAKKVGTGLHRAARQSGDVIMAFTTDKEARRRMVEMV